MRNIKKTIKLLSRTVALSLNRNNKNLDYRGITTDPIYAAYLDNSEGFKINLDVRNGGEFLYTDYSKYSASPYYQASLLMKKLEADKGASLKDAVYSVLNKYAELVRIEKPSHLFGIRELSAKFTEGMSIWQWALPWEQVDVEERVKKREQNIRNENLQYGLDSSLSLQDCGAGHKKVDIEAERLTSLADSIKKNGYLANDDEMVLVNVYSKGDEFVWRVISGMHRSAILVAFGWSEIPVKVNMIIRRSDVSHWPGVVSGFYSNEIALRIFDNVYNAKAPPAFHAWQAHIESRLDFR